MSRPLRIEYPGALYHVTSRGNERKNIIITDDDKIRFLSIVATAFERFKILIYAYCLMTNHYHLLLETTKANLSKCMQYINSTYTTYFNRKGKRCGHLFQGRYLAILVEEAEYLTRISRYIHLNPIRAKMVKYPEEYKWSSYRYYKNNNKEAPSYLETKRTLEYFDGESKRYIEYVEEGLVKKIENPLLEAFAGVILGRKKFIEDIKREYIDEEKKEMDLPALKKIKKSLREPEEIVGIINKTGGFSDKERNKMIVYFLRKYTDKTFTNIASNLSGNRATSAISSTYYRLDKNRQTDRKLDKMLIELECKMRKNEV